MHTYDVIILRRRFVRLIVETFLNIYCAVQNAATEVNTYNCKPIYVIFFALYPSFQLYTTDTVYIHGIIFVFTSYKELATFGQTAFPGNNYEKPIKGFLVFIIRNLLKASTNY